LRGEGERNRRGAALGAQFHPVGFALTGATDFDGQAQGQAGILFAEADGQLIRRAARRADGASLGVGNGDIGQCFLVEPGGKEGAELLA